DRFSATERFSAGEIGQDNSVGVETVDVNEGAERFGGTLSQLIEDEGVTKAAEGAISRRHFAGELRFAIRTAKGGPWPGWNRRFGDLAEQGAMFSGDQLDPPHHHAGHPRCNGNIQRQVMV